MIILHSTPLWTFSLAIATAFAMHPGASSSNSGGMCSRVKVHLIKIFNGPNMDSACTATCKSAILDYAQGRISDAWNERLRVADRFGDVTAGQTVNAWNADWCVARPSGICYSGGALNGGTEEEQTDFFNGLLNDHNIADQLVSGCTSGCSAPKSRSIYRKGKIAKLGGREVAKSHRTCVCRMTIHYESVHLAEEDPLQFGQGSSSFCALAAFADRQAVGAWSQYFPPSASAAFPCASKTEATCICHLDSDPSEGEQVYCTAFRLESILGVWPDGPV